MKLRLLVNEKCNRNCALCVNKQYNLAELHVETKFTQYSEIILTGGEPMLYPDYLKKVILYLRDNTFPHKTKIWLQTAKIDNTRQAMEILDLVDGITVTIHDKNDVEPFRSFDAFINAEYSELSGNKSLKLCIFEGTEMPETFCIWQVHQIKWLKECPLPENEVFKRFAFVD